MDLHFTSDAATADERAAVDLALGPARDGVTGAASRARRHLLLPILHAVVDRIGWISPGALNYVSERLEVAPAEVYGVATFYALFSTTPRPPRVVHVCDDIACICAGSGVLCSKLESAWGRPGELSHEATTTWLRSPCLGLCDRAPAALVTTAGDRPSARQHAPVDAERLLAAITPDADGGPPMPHIGGSELRLLRRVGKVDPESLDEYRANGGYRALREATALRPDRVVAEIIASNLLGRGGAAFPTGRKMAAVADAPGPHYLICNADESEPGTFKDRVLMEQDPFAIVEGMTIAAYAIGCERAFIYIRGEYSLATQRLAGAIAQARGAGLLGEAVMGAGTSFDIEIRRGAGAYICGEETALFNSIEGKRGEPRTKPPFPGGSRPLRQADAREQRRNARESSANSARRRGERTRGSERRARRARGSSAFPAASCAPGLYEVPHGTTLETLIELAGGVPPARRLQAILLGGAAGTIVAPDALTMPLTFEDARARGTTLGSGVVMLFDDTVDMVAILQRIARFFREESCGQCVPCRVGTVRQAEALQRLSCADGTSAQRAHDVVLLDEIGAAMRDASICGLGQTASNAIESARKNLGLLAAGNAK